MAGLDQRRCPFPFFSNATPTPEIYPLPLHDAFPICQACPRNLIIRHSIRHLNDSPGGSPSPDCAAAKLPRLSFGGFRRVFVAPTQIGRASCREWGEMSVGPG